MQRLSWRRRACGTARAQADKAVRQRAQPAEMLLLTTWRKLFGEGACGIVRTRPLGRWHCFRCCLPKYSCASYICVCGSVYIHVCIHVHRRQFHACVTCVCHLCGILSFRVSSAVRTPRRNKLSVGFPACGEDPHSVVSRFTITTW